jgi:hypothetical protein
MNAYPHCKFCQGSGCLACPGERKKAERAAAKWEEDRIAKLKAMTPEEILGTLPDKRLGLKLAAQCWNGNFSGFVDDKSNPDTLEIEARSLVLKDLADGGHEFPTPDPIMVADPDNADQMAELKKLIHGLIGDQADDQ